LKNVLIFPAGSEVGLEIFECLNQSIHFHVIGGNSVPDHSDFVFPDLLQIPNFRNPDFLNSIKEVIQNNKIDFIYPAMDEVGGFLKFHENKIGAIVIGSPFKSFEIANDKSKTYEYFNGIVRVPVVFNDTNHLNFPIFLKPKVGYGSRGTATINNNEELFFWYKYPDNQLLVEFLPGEEFTVDCFSDKTGNLLYFSPRTRARIRMGISVHSSFASEEIRNELKPIAEKINLALPIRSAWFFQVKRANDGEFVLMEIGLRPAGSSSLNRLKDVNLPLLSLFDFQDIGVKINPNPVNGRIDRAFSTKAKIDLNFNQLFIDLDDCIIFNNRLNPKAIELIIHCHNAGKEVCLITKHKGDLSKTLADFKISSLFDIVIHLNNEQKKKDYLLPNSLFVDDSFAERQDAMSVENVIAYGNESLSLLNSQFIL